MRRFSGRWSLTADFSHLWTRDHANNYLGQTIRANAVPINPTDLISTDDGGRHVFAITVPGLRVAKWLPRVFRQSSVFVDISMPSMPIPRRRSAGRPIRSCARSRSCRRGSCASA